jgi:hypothetical protein
MFSACEEECSCRGESGKAELSMRTQHEPGVAKDECEIYVLLGREILG